MAEVQSRGTASTAHLLLLHDPPREGPPRIHAHKLQVVGRLLQLLLLKLLLLMSTHHLRSALVHDGLRVVGHGEKLLPLLLLLLMLTVASHVTDGDSQEVVLDSWEGAE